MGNEHKRWRLSECLETVVDNRGKTPPNDGHETEFQLLEVNCITGTNRKPNYALVRKYVTLETYNNWFRNGHPTKDDVIISTVGSIGEVCLFDGRGCIAQNLVALRAKSTILEGSFLFYYLCSRKVKNELLSLNISSVQPSIKVPHLLDLEIPLPPLPEQKAIAHILGSLDDKIELNRRMNKTLEAMAQALFKSWFVDFDPVIDNALAADNDIPEPLKDKAAAREALGDARKSLPEDIRQHFPCRFEFTEEMGWIPEGWEIGPIKTMGEVICGKTPPTKNIENFGEDVPFITIPDMHGKVYITQTVRKLSIIGATTQAKKYLPPNSICVSCIATPGLVAITSEPSQTNQQINTVVPFRPSGSFFCYESLSILGDLIRISGSGGSVFSNLSKGRFEQLIVLIPSIKSQEYFHTTVQPYFDKLIVNQKNNEKLAALRDTLLPKLLSGELRIPDAEKLVEEVL
ncbi:MAG: restriction endonuclease subunit S [Desulfoplanes sp.]